MGTIQVDADVCQKAAVNGVDRGPASIWLVRSAIKDPNESRKPDSSTVFNQFIFEIISDNPFVVEVLREGLVNPRLGNLTASFEPQSDPSFMGKLTGSAKAAEGSTYSGSGYPRKATEREQEIHRWYYGSEDNAYWEVSRSLMTSSGDGPGTLEASQNSVIAKVGNGITHWAAMTKRQDAEYVLLRNPTPS